MISKERAPVGASASLPRHELLSTLELKCGAWIVASAKRHSSALRGSFLKLPIARGFSRGIKGSHVERLFICAPTISRSAGAVAGKITPSKSTSVSLRCCRFLRPAVYLCIVQIVRSARKIRTAQGGRE
eukprot:6206861-Pleurochrysis_carterae.AAC.2